MRSPILLIALIALLLGAQSATARNDWPLVWADEFTGEGLPDTSNWRYDVGGDGWGNDELQHYTAQRLQNARIENGLLVIEAHREKPRLHLGTLSIQTRLDLWPFRNPRQDACRPRHLAGAVDATDARHLRRRALLA